MAGSTRMDPSQTGERGQSTMAASAELKSLTED